MHKQVCVQQPKTAKFVSKFSREPLSGISDQRTPPPNWNLDRSWHFEYFQFWLQTLVITVFVMPMGKIETSTQDVFVQNLVRQRIQLRQITLCYLVFDICRSMIVCTELLSHGILPSGHLPDVLSVTLSDDLVLLQIHVVLCRWVFSSVRDACGCFHMVLDLSPPRNTHSFCHVAFCRWVPNICQMMFALLIICVMWYVLRIETRSRHEETRPHHIELHDQHHHQLIPTDLIPGLNHKGADLQQKSQSKSKVRMTFSTTRKHSSRMRTARLPTIPCFDGHVTRCCPVQ